MAQSFEITCPQCGYIIPLDETLAGPEIARIRAEALDAVNKAHKEAQAKLADAAKLQEAVAAKERSIAEREASVKAEIDTAVARERQTIASAERTRLEKEMAPQLEAERNRAKELQAKVDQAQAAELELRKQSEAVEQRAKALELEIERKVAEKRKGIYEEASREADAAAHLKLAERDKTIADMQAKLEEAQRKAMQGSQQLQGEVLELDFESTLRQMFPRDTVEPVKTGARGGDILQHVEGEMGRAAGTMFWELKRAQTWGGDWIAKAKKDAADAKAVVATIVSEVLPKGIVDFGLQDGIWCVKPSLAPVLGLAIRQGIINTAEASQRAHGRETKVERLYEYMIGPEFRATLEGIALPFSELQEELNAEKRATLSRWKRQEKRIERVLNSVASLQGDLQGIAGKELPALPGFALDTAIDESTD